PIWVCQGCNHMKAFESMKALEDAGAEGFDTTVDKHLQIHKPWVDRITCPCPECGLKMERVSEVIDCWFDSGCMPFAQFGFPHKGVDRFRHAFPADFISEAVDQTRGWFYSLMIIATMLFDEDTQKAYGLDPVDVPRPYRNCIVLGHVGDMTGKKESKSTGNYTSPDLVLRGRMKMRVVGSPEVARGTISMVKIATRSLELGADEKLGVSHEETGEVVGHVAVVPGPNHGKETVAMHPDDMAAWGITGSAWFHAPFQAPGADAFRWLFYASNPPWTNTRNSLRSIREGQRKFHLRLMNVFSFFSIYANINGFTPKAVVASGHALDRWILGELDRTVATVTDQMDQYLVYESARAITDFVDGLSNWYVRRSRARFWGEGDDTTAALSSLYTVLVGLSRVIAPFVPFLADAMFTRLVPGAGSVHLQAWPEDEGRLDPALAERMAMIRELASLGLAARDKVGVRVRQPLRAAEVVLADKALQAGLEPLLFLLKDELNVREIRFSARADAFVEYLVKPNYKALGKRLGKDMKACAAAVASADPAAIQAATQGDGFVVELPSGPVTLTSDDVLVEVQPREGFQASGSARAVVALHADLDDDLREEGLSRELINRIQTERKNLDLGYTDRIRVEVRGDDALQAAATRFAEHIQHEVLAISMDVGPLAGDAPLDVDGHGLMLAVQRA
ncbi:MAG: class I tRNA ligase family protein, partial [Myxococcales bacterium]|nr:class I tRNA ligase family protein [Myxococcales bacterium]